MAGYKYEKSLRLRDSLWLNFLILNVSGYWGPERNSKYAKFAYLIYAIIVLNFTYFVYITSEIINVVTLSSDLEKITDASFLLLTHFAQFFKIIYFFKNRALMLELLKMMKEDILQPISERQFVKLSKTMKYAANFYYIFLLMAVGTVSLWGAFPVLDKTNDGPLHLPLSAWYPFDTNPSPVFEIIYGYQLFAVLTDGLANISLDTMCTGLMAHVCGQLDNLNDTLENLKFYAGESIIKMKETDGRNLTKQEMDLEMEKLLTRCVHHHRRIME